MRRLASFTKRGKTWQYTISSKPKPIRKGGFKTKKEAQIAAAEIEAKLGKGLAVKQVVMIEIAEYFETWFRTFKTDITDNTLKSYELTLKHVKEHFDGVYIQNIEKRRYQSFLNEFGKTHAKVTTKKVNGHIRACVRDAIDEGLLSMDFTRGAVLSGKKGKARHTKYLDYEEAEKLLEIIHDRLNVSPTYYLLLLALTTGMRFAEIVGLTRKDFNFDDSTINIDKTWGYTKKMAKGFGTTKNEQSIRVIPVDNKTMKIFKEWFDRTPDNVKRLVFYSPTSRYHVISNGVANKVLNGILDKIGVKKSIGVHGLRHTFASIQLYKGVSIYSVSEHLGHTEINTTMNIYTHIIKELRTKDKKLMTDSFSTMYKGVV